VQASALAWMLFSPELNRSGLLDFDVSEVLRFGMLEAVSEQRYFSYSEANANGRVEAGVFFSCLQRIAEGGWAAVRFTAEHPAVPHFHAMQWPTRSRVCIVKQKVVTAYYNHSKK
jgi:hypothetical protein